MVLDRSSTIGILGCGLVGNSLAIALSQSGYPVIATASRTYASANALAERIAGCSAFNLQGAVDATDVVFITTPDDAILGVAADTVWRKGQGVIHCSGACSLDLLNACVAQGAIPGAFHPLQAFSSVDAGVKSISGITFGIEGTSEMTAYLERMALHLKAHPILLRSEDKALYHLTGVLMGNLLTEYVAIAANLWHALGLTREDGLRALVPMMRQVVVNLETSGLPGAVSGPYARGDLGTVRKHVKALAERSPDLLPLYCSLAIAGLPFAEEKGTLSPHTVEQIVTLLKEGLVLG